MVKEGRLKRKAWENRVEKGRKEGRIGRVVWLREEWREGMRGWC